MDLQDAIERFLSDSKRQRSRVTVRRYGEAMDIFQSYLALERMDADDSAERESGSLVDVTPESVGRFIQSFLLERFGDNARAYRRYVAATRAFVSWLDRAGFLPNGQGDAMKEVLRSAARAGGEPQESGDGGIAQLLWEGAGWERINERERIYQVVEVDPGSNTALLVELVSGKEVVGGPLPEGPPLVSGDLVAGVRQGDGVTALRLLASIEDLEEDEGDEGESDWDLDDEDEDESIWGGDGPVVEYALEILSSEDRYAPREVVQAILSNMEEAQDELLEWLLDEEYRDEPLPGTGEAPANAARLLSEVRYLEAIPRLLSVLGDTDPLGDEAPAALGRYGVQVLGRLVEVVEEHEASVRRRADAIWALAHLAARNPAWRTEVVDAILAGLHNAPNELVSASLDALEDLRAVEGLESISRLARSGELDLEATGRTLPLVQGRIRSEGLGDRLAEGMVPIVFLYPTTEELEEFYESIEEDLGAQWEGVDDEEQDSDDDDGDDLSDGAPTDSEGGKVLPFRRPPQ